jgi:hypothetical protein
LSSEDTGALGENLTFIERHNNTWASFVLDSDADYIRHSLRDGNKLKEAA